MSFPIDAVRARFPALATTDAGHPRAYLDAPGGTQVCAPAIAAMVAHLERGTANSGGAFASSIETDAMSAAAHRAMADLLGGDTDEIAFGPNMTSLTLAVSRSLARDWRAGDEIVLSRLDHDANVAPWLMAAADRGVTVRWIELDAATGTLRTDAMALLVSERTRLVAVAGASNALGTVNDLTGIIAAVRAHSSALVYVDAVQWVPHLVTDVRALDCDFLACSPYKFFGPHQGVLWVRRAVAEALTAYKVRPASIAGAARFETGTPSFEGQAGVLGTIDYLEWLGAELGATGDRRSKLVAAFEGCLAYECALGRRLLDGLGQINGLRLYGPPTMAGRVPTFAFTIEGHDSDAVARHLAGHGIFAWSGHFYAIEPLSTLDVAASGGLVRVGLCHYNTTEEVDRVVEVLGRVNR